MVDIRSDMPNTLGLFVSTFALLIGFKTPSREIGRMRFQNKILYWNAHTVLSNVKYCGKMTRSMFHTFTRWVKAVSYIERSCLIDNSQTLRA